MSENFLSELLSIIINSKVSDVFLTAGKSIYVRESGSLKEYKQYTISASDIDNFRKSTISEEMEKNYSKSGAVDCAFILPQSNQRCRLNFFEAEAGPTVVIRPIKDGNSITFEGLRLPLLLKEMVKQSRGIILVTGATGSGKSSTMAAMINEINTTQSKHILTIEDPIEFVYDNKKSLVSQREVLKHTESFPEAIRNAMRENPDVIVIGEMRDAETMQSALSAALTGHLVITTVHTSNAVLALERLISMVAEDHREQLAIDLSLAMVGIISQRLLPTVDNSGVVPALEILQGTPLVCKMIAERKFNDLEQTLRESTGQGMITFARSIYKLYESGIISRGTAFNYVDNPDEFRLLLQGMESGVGAFQCHYGERNEANENAIDMATLLRSAVKLKSSDLILSVNASPSVRLNGIIQAMDLPLLGPLDTQRLLYSVINSHQRVIFEEKRELDFALAVSLNLTREPGAEKVYRFRLNAFYQRGNIGLVARVINSEIPSVKQLRLPNILTELVSYKQGLILVTGPTGSGKSIA